MSDESLFARLDRQRARLQQARDTDWRDASERVQSLRELLVATERLLQGGTPSEPEPRSEEARELWRYLARMGGR